MKKIVYFIALLFIFASCEEYEYQPDKIEQWEIDAQLECGDSLIWKYQNPLEYTQLIIDIVPMDSTQGNPVTSFWWFEKGTYITPSYDGGGSNFQCYMFHKYIAYALIDGGDPNTIGDFVFYEEGMVRKVNILDGISWN